MGYRDVADLIDRGPLIFGSEQREFYLNEIKRLIDKALPGNSIDIGAKEAELRTGHPLIRRLLDEITAQGLRRRDVEKRAGVGHGAIDKWVRKRAPTLVDFEAAVNSVGLEVVLVRKEN